MGRPLDLPLFVQTRVVRGGPILLYLLRLSLHQDEITPLFTSMFINHFAAVQLITSLDK